MTEPLADLISRYWLAERRRQAARCVREDSTPQPTWLGPAADATVDAHDRPTVVKPKGDEP